MAIDLIGFGIVLPILPLYARRFHATPIESTLLVAAFSAASLVCSPLWGRVSDRFGRRPVLIVSLLGTAAGSLLTGLAGGLVLLYVGRLVDGASGASISVAQATVADLADADQRPRLFGLLGAAFGVGLVAGPALGALASLGGPRLPFLLASAIAALNAVVAQRRLPETRPAEVRRARPASPPPPAGPGAAASPGTRRRGLLGLGGGLLPLVVVSFCALCAFSGFESTLALYGHHHLGLTVGSSAATFAVIGLALVAVQAGMVGPIVDRIGEPAALLAGLGADAAGLALLAAARSWPVAVPALALLTAGQALVQTTMSSTLAARAEPSRRGEVLGIQQAAGGMGRVAGPALAGALLGSSASGAPYEAGALICLVAVAVLASERALAARSPGR